MKIKQINGEMQVIITCDDSIEYIHTLGIVKELNYLVESQKRK